jgi:hypothetical protein
VLPPVGGPIRCCAMLRELFCVPNSPSCSCSGNTTISWTLGPSTGLGYSPCAVKLSAPHHPVADVSLVVGLGPFCQMEGYSLWTPLPPPRPDLHSVLLSFGVIQSCRCHCHQPVGRFAGDSVPLSSSLPKDRSRLPSTSRAFCCGRRIDGRCRIEVGIGVIQTRPAPAKISIRSFK